MKRWFFLPLLLLLLCLAACASTAVSYRIDGDNRVDFGYTMAFSPEGKDISKYVQKIAKHWESLGFTVEIGEADGTTTLSGVKTVQCETMQEAVDTLAKAWTDQDSLFHDVRFTYEPSYLQDDFSLEASISLKDLLRQSPNAGLPAAEVRKLLDAAASSEFTLSIALPGEVERTNADAQDGAVCTWNLKYGEERRIALSTTHVSDSNAAYYTMLRDFHARDTVLSIALATLAVGMLLAAAILLALRARRRRAQQPPAAPTWSAPTDLNQPYWNPPAPPAQQDWNPPEDPTQSG